MKKDSKNYLSNLCDTFSLSNLIPGVACVKSSVVSSIDVMLTNKPISLHHTSLIETGLSDCHKLILSFFRAFFKWTPAKTIEYRNYSKFSPEAFLRKLDQELNKEIIYYSQDKQYDLFSDIFRTILDHHAPLKTITIRGNQANFMTKELGKSIMNRSRFKNRYLKWPSRENFLDYKKAKNLYNSLNKKAKKLILKRLQKTESWVVKSFGVPSNLSFHQKASFIIMTFNSHYINIVKSTTGKNPTKLGTLASRISKKEIVATITDNSKIIRAL